MSNPFKKYINNLLVIDNITKLTFIINVLNYHVTI